MKPTRGDWLQYRPRGSGNRIWAVIEDYAPNLAIKVIPARGYRRRWIPLNWVARIKKRH